MMKNKKILFLCAVFLLNILAGCAAAPEPSPTPEKAAVADAADMAAVIDVEEEGMEPVYGSSLNDGTYKVSVDSSSSMFRIEECELEVSGGEMTAVMTMSGTGYLYVYMGTAEEAAAAGSAECIPYVENSDGSHSFTVPVEALDKGIDCAAFSKSKELWYARTLVFRADSLPLEASKDNVTLDSLGLADGDYTIEVSLEGGSGKASLSSPAKLTVKDGSCTAEIMWSSPNYDYMKVGDTQYFPINTEGNSVFEIPVLVFDRGMPVIADTVAMSQPYELEYSICFYADTIKPAS